MHLLPRTFATLVITATLIPSAFAQVMTEKDGNTVRMTFGSDLYSAGEDNVIEGIVEDDVLAAGAQVEIFTNIPGDVMAAGGKINMRGTVGDDLRIAGGDISISGGVANDALIMGGTVRLLETSTITGSVMIFGGDITIDGVIKGDLLIRGGNVTINGRVGGKTDMRGGNVRLNGELFGDTILSAAKVTMGSSAVIAGNLRYWQQSGEESFAGVQGTSTFDSELSIKNPEETAEFAAGLLGIFAFFTLFSGALMIGVLMLLTKTLFADSAKQLIAAPWMSLLIGFLFFAVTPIIGVVLLVTIIGLPLAVVVFALYLISMLFAKAITALVFAHWMQMRAKKKWHPFLLFLVALGILILLKIIGVIPFIGWIVCSVLTLMGFGAYLQTKYERSKKLR